MKKYHALMIITVFCMHFFSINYACPCMPSPKESEPFFEQNNVPETQNDEENNEE